MFHWIKQLLCSHRWINPSDAECFHCGYQPRCKKHNIPKYVHGFYNDLDCIMCDRELKKQLDKMTAYTTGNIERK